MSQGPFFWIMEVIVEHCSYDEAITVLSDWGVDVEALVVPITKLEVVLMTDEVGAAEEIEEAGVTTKETLEALQSPMVTVIVSDSEQLGVPDAIAAVSQGRGFLITDVIVEHCPVVGSGPLTNDVEVSRTVELLTELEIEILVDAVCKLLEELTAEVGENGSNMLDEVTTELFTDDGFKLPVEATTLIFEDDMKAILVGLVKELDVIWLLV